MNAPVGTRGANFVCDLGQDVACAVVADRMDGVEPKTVGMIFFDPVKRVVNEECARRFATHVVEIDRSAPGGPVLFVKKERAYALR